MIRILGSMFATCLVLAPSPAGAQTAAKETVVFLTRLQTPSGAFLAAPPKPNERAIATLRSTSAATRAIHYFGAEVPNKEKCVAFVDRCWDIQVGGFADTPGGKPDFVTTAIGLMAVRELKMPKQKYADGAIRYISEHAKSFEEIRIAVAGLEAIQAKSPQNADWIKDVRQLQNADGTFGKDLGQARATGSAAVSLLRMGVKLDHADAVLRALNAGQRADGGWGKDDSKNASDLETTYRVMRCFMMMKARPDNVPGLRAFLAKCRHDDGGYGVTPGAPSTVSGTYFAGSVFHWLKQ